MGGSNTAPTIVVVGSINVNLVLTAARLPRAGETITGAALAEVPGGKGANQALAARRLGAEVSLVGRVGDDARASIALANLEEAGVDLSHVGTDDVQSTGVAAVTVGPGASSG